MVVVGEGAVGAAHGVDAQAFRALYDRTLPQIYGYFVHRSGVTVAEDLTQETYIAAAQALRTNIEVSLPWLLAVARNKLVDHFRRAEREERRMLRAWRLRDREPAQDPLEGQPGGAGDAVAALSTLPVAQRAALVLHHIDGRSVREVAELLDRSEEAVESLLARGRRAFRRHYEELCDG